jgi:glycosyltransferase involved in cell wall biosynthesis
MKILMVHNSYQHDGGEDIVANEEKRLLESYGHYVYLYSRHNSELKEIPKTTAAISALWSTRTENDLEHICEELAPDIIHVHNTFPLISPSVYWTASRKKIPVIQTLHNFRLLCPQATFLRDGNICEDCVGKLPWRSVARRCYRGSALQSAVTTGMLGLHRIIGTYEKKVARYIVLNKFCLEKFVQGGFPEDLFRIKPNFVHFSGLPNWHGRSGGAYIGRLSAEKGIELLCQAKDFFNAHSFDIIGKGPLQSIVQQRFGANYLGYMPPDEVLSVLGTKMFVVIPSTCYETFPLVVIEAFACGTPVIASRHGALGEIIKDGITGLLFTSGDTADLAKKIEWAEQHPSEMLRMGRAARLEYEEKYTSARNYEILMEIYKDVLLEPEL